MKIAAVIPARLSSSRFPRKVMCKIHGLPMLEHVRRRALICKGFSDVFVATCDEEIAEMTANFGGNFIMTSKDHINGTSRVSEAIKHIDCTHAVILQGDEPLILPRHIEFLLENIKNEPSVDTWNLIAELDSKSELNRHSFVKGAVNCAGNIMFCFRKSPFFSDFNIQSKIIKKLLGVIAFRKEFLLKFVDFEPTPIEKAESIEQMRIIENDMFVRGVLVSPSLPSVNEPDELIEVVNLLDLDGEQKKYLDLILNDQ
ncbi:3-deoxy-manno-octulosonate cytidylyltransferase [Candidatus Methylopumilus planktonicus]|uniref:3-deoxy-manno-octulosonate cytidylyltransferase n=1 Tax=Candidatus Methylopumilus planktonicus TaxID=1581557 RepID=UPI003BEF4718